MSLRVATPMKMPECVCGLPHKMTDGEGPGSFRAALKASSASSPRKGTDRKSTSARLQQQQAQQTPPPVAAGLDRSIRSRSTSGETQPSTSSTSSASTRATSAAASGSKAGPGQRVSGGSSKGASPARKRSPAPAAMAIGGSGSRGSTPTKALTPTSDSDSSGLRVALGAGARRKTPSGDSTKSRASLDSDRTRLSGSSEGLASSGRKKNASGSSGSSRSSQREVRVFDQYLTLQEVQQGLKKGELIEGVLRINPKNFEDAYISAPDEQMDIYIGGVRERNRALHGDVVVVRLKPVMQWKVVHENVRHYIEKYASKEDEMLLMSGAKIITNSETPASEIQVPKISDPILEENCENNGFEIGIWKEGKAPKPMEVIVEEHVESKTKQKSGRKRPRKRGKGSAQQENNNTDETDQVPHPFEATGERPPDTLVILGMENLTLALNREKRKPKEHRKKSGKVVVAPHELTETETSDDDGSVDSIVVDLEQVTEDQEFYKANLGGWQGQQNEEDLAQGQEQSDVKKEAKEESSVLVQNLPVGEVVNESSDHPKIEEEHRSHITLSTGNNDNINNNNENNNNNCSNTKLNQDLSEDRETNSSFHEVFTAVEESQDSSSTFVYPKPSLSLSSLLSSPCANPQQTCINENDKTSSETEIKQVDNIGEEKSVSKAPQNDKTSSKTEVKQVGNNGEEKNVNEVPQNDETSSETKVKQVGNNGEEKSVNEAPQNDETSSETEVKQVGNNGGEKSMNEVPQNDKTSSETEVKQVSNNGKEKSVNEAPQNDKKGKQRKSRKKLAKKQARVSKCEKDVKPEGVKKENKVARQTREGFVEFSMLSVLQHPLWGRFVQRTAVVVYLKERCHTLCGVGFLKPMADSNPNWVLFSPRDHRVPRMRIPAEQCPPHFREKPDDYASTLFVARVVKWNEMNFAIGELVKNLGNAEDIEPQTIAILDENGVSHEPFDEEILKSLPKTPWTIPEDELLCRRDFRNECVFTIDPLTARDLDDAVSCKFLSDGLYEVGVHIADVSYFLKEETLLDKEAAERATSVYMVQKMIPMLPATLCTDLCSLHAGEDKLTFSVVWKMTEKGDIKEEWFGRSVIRSCVKMSYEHAQAMIDEPSKQWSTDQLPPISGPFKPSDISHVINTLKTIAENLRHKRFEKGALRLDQPKLSFALDGTTGLPVGFSVYEHTQSHRLIEDLMLLANQAVACKLYATFPHLAFLRHHPPPQARMMEEVQELLASLGIHIHSETSGTLQESLTKYAGKGDLFSETMMLVMVNLLSKPMQCAKYFCAGVLKDESMFQHYALSVPFYTHFTSPIRRYADVMVHRLLAAALSYASAPSWDPKAVHRIAEHCNKKKLAARVVQELSVDLFLAQYVRSCGPINEEPAMVMDVKDYSCDVLLPRLGAVRRLYVNSIPATFKFCSECGVDSLLLMWEPTDDDPLPRLQELSIFSLVRVSLLANKDPMRFNVVLLRPNPQQLQQDSSVT